MDKLKFINQWRIIVHFFRPILLVMCTPGYDLAKFFVPILKPLTKNEYKVHDSFHLNVKLVNLLKILKV